MSFARIHLSKILEQNIVAEAESIRLHKIGNDVFEMCVDGRSILLTADAGIDLSFRLAEFLSSTEHDR